MRTLLIGVLCFTHTFSFGQLKDFSQLMILTNYNESQIINFLRLNDFEFVGKDYDKRIGHNISFWSYEVGKQTEGGIGYYIAESGIPVIIYLTLDPIFLVDAIKNIETYGFSLEKTVKRNQTETSYIYSYKKASLLVRAWRDGKTWMIMFLIGRTTDMEEIYRRDRMM